MANELKKGQNRPGHDFARVQSKLTEWREHFEITLNHFRPENSQLSP